MRRLRCLPMRITDAGANPDRGDFVRVLSGLRHHADRLRVHGCGEERRKPHGSLVLRQFSALDVVALPSSHQKDAYLPVASLGVLDSAASLIPSVGRCALVSNTGTRVAPFLVRSAWYPQDHCRLPLSLRLLNGRRTLERWRKSNELDGEVIDVARSSSGTVTTPFSSSGPYLPV